MIYSSDIQTSDYRIGYLAGYKFSIGRKRAVNKDLKINPGIDLDILKIRYAKGEITKEQFEQMRKDLG